MIRKPELLAQRYEQEFSSRIRKEMVLQSSLAMESQIDMRGASKAVSIARVEKRD